ncbi:MAG: hypothetical protein ACRBDX_07890 [Gammaproteobacteria bacterium]
MKTKALLTAALIATTNFAWAQGGITVDNFEQYMNVSNGVPKIESNQVRTYSNEPFYFNLNEIGKPSSGPVYSGQSSKDPVYFNLSDIGKPSSGPVYNNAS